MRIYFEEELGGEYHVDYKTWIDYRLASGGTVEIFDVQVSNEHRREGRGQSLVEMIFRLFEKAPTVWAITRADNLIAQQWYEALGFEVTGVLRRFYDRESKAVDAIVYGRSPKGPV